MEELPKFPKPPAPSYCRFQKVTPLDVGWFIFKLTDLKYNIREGRFKQVLYKPIKKKPPLKPDAELTMIPMSLDFTIEVIDYTTRDKNLFSYRRKKRIPPEEKK